MLYDPRPARRLCRLLNNYRSVGGLSLRQFHQRIPIASHSTLRRLLCGDSCVSMEILKFIADALSAEFETTPEQFISDLFRKDPPARGPLAELALAWVWPRGHRAAGRLAESLSARMARASTIVWRDTYLPCWLAPDNLLLLCARCSQGSKLNFAQLRATLAIARPIRNLLLGDANETRTTLVPLLRSEIEAVARQAPPFNGFTPAKISELISEITGNAVAHHRILPALIDDTDKSFPDSLHHHLARCATMIAVDNRLLVKRLHGSSAWLVYDREGGDDIARHIDAELQTLAELNQWVRHDLTADAVSDALEAVLRGETRWPGLRIPRSPTASRF